MKGLAESIRGCSRYAAWKRKIISRDKECVLCGFGDNLTVDHFPRTMAQILRDEGISSKKQAKACAALWDEKSGRVLCGNCHAMVNKYDVSNQTIRPEAWRRIAADLESMLQGHLVAEAAC